MSEEGRQRCSEATAEFNRRTKTGITLSDEHKKKIGESVKKAFQNPETQEKLKKRIPWNKGLTKETDERVAKNYEALKQSMIEKYGVENAGQIPKAIKSGD